MKNALAILVATAGLTLGGSALAVDLPSVGQQKCAACHAVDHQLVGPAFKDVAAKYKGKKDAVATIEAHIKTGGSFGWKLGVLPPRGLGASDADVDCMARFIVGLSK